MKKLSVFLLSSSILFVACSKEEISSVKPESPAVIEEDPLITKARNYFNTNVLQEANLLLEAATLDKV